MYHRLWNNVILSKWSGTKNVHFVCLFALIWDMSDAGQEILLIVLREVQGLRNFAGCQIRISLMQIKCSTHTTMSVVPEQWLVNPEYRIQS